MQGDTRVLCRELSKPEVMQHLLTIHPALAHCVLNEDYAEIQKVAKLLLQNGVDSASAAPAPASSSASDSTIESELPTTRGTPAHVPTTPAVFPSTQPKTAQHPATQQTNSQLQHVQTPHTRTISQSTKTVSSVSNPATPSSTISPTRTKATVTETNRPNTKNIPVAVASMDTQRGGSGSSMATQRGGSGSEPSVAFDEELERQREVRVGEGMSGGRARVMH